MNKKGEKKTFPSAVCSGTRIFNFFPFYFISSGVIIKRIIFHPTICNYGIVYVNEYKKKTF